MIIILKQNQIFEVYLLEIHVMDTRDEWFEENV